MVDDEVEVGQGEREKAELERLLVLEQRKRVAEVQDLHREVIEAQTKQEQLEIRLTLEHDRRMRAQKMLERYQNAYTSDLQRP